MNHFYEFCFGVGLALGAIGLYLLAVRLVP